MRSLANLLPVRGYIGVMVTGRLCTGFAAFIVAWIAGETSGDPEGASGVRVKFV